MLTTIQSRPRTRLKSFTLVESLVVVGIIIALVAISLPSAFGMVKLHRERLTLATMKVLSVAIDQFVGDRGCLIVPDTPQRQMRQNPWDPLIFDPFINLFDRFPPSPTTAYACGYSTLGKYTGNPPLGGPYPAPPYPATDEAIPETNLKFLRLVNVMKNHDIKDCGACCYCTPWKFESRPGFEAKYASIECLVFALREIDPKARAIVDRLLKTAGANLDQDLAYHDSKDANCQCAEDCAYQPACEEAVDLFEILDAWKQPLRYAIREPWKDPTNPTNGFNLKWELRSAGDDGIFSPPFTPADQSDDVILQGP